MTYQLMLHSNGAWYIRDNDGTIIFKTRDTNLAKTTYERLLNDETRTSSVYTPNKTT
jgi:hypothetical protein